MSTGGVYLVTNRARKGDSFGGKLASGGALSYALRDMEEGPEGAWRIRSRAGFRKALMADLGRHPEQPLEDPHPPRIVIPIHGFNVSFEESEAFADRVHANLTSKLPGTAVTVGFSWPSLGSVAGYAADSAAARASAESLTEAFIHAIRTLEAAACPAELIGIPHSRGNYVLANAGQWAAEARGNPQSHNVFSEVLMCAADLDAESLEPGKLGANILRWSRRTTVLYSKADRALLASSVKRAGTTGARLGRSGPARWVEGMETVVGLDCTEYTKGIPSVMPHSAYFHSPEIWEQMRQICMGEDRSEIQGRIGKSGHPNNFRMTPRSNGSGSGTSRFPNVAREPDFRIPLKQGGGA